MIRSSYRLFPAFLVFCLFSVSGFSQQQPEKPGDTKQGDRSGVKIPQRPGSRERESEMVRPIYLSGTVVLEDGTSLPGAVPIQLRCNGSVRETVYSTSDGHFSFTLGTNRPTGGGMDASVGGRSISVGGPSLSGSRNTDPFQTAGIGKSLGFGRVDLSSCRCEATLPGYRSEAIQLGFRSVFDSPDIGAITLSPLGGVKGGIVSLNTLSAPAKARKEYQKGIKELRKKKSNYNRAAKYLSKATDIYPEFAAAWQLLGETHLAKGEEEGARVAFQHALKSDPDYVNPYLSLAELELRQSNWSEAENLTGQALKINPYVIQAHYFLAMAQFYLGRTDAAFESVRRVQESSEAHLYPASHYLLGGIYSDKGDFEAAVSEFRKFLTTDPPEHIAAQLRQTIHDWETQGLIKPFKPE